jgi:hypothetical protein
VGGREAAGFTSSTNHAQKMRATHGHAHSRCDTLGSEPDGLERTTDRRPDGRLRRYRAARTAAAEVGRRPG